MTALLLSFATLWLSLDALREDARSLLGIYGVRIGAWGVLLASVSLCTR